jgi:hypothetical protein
MACNIISIKDAYKQHRWQKKTATLYNGIAEILNTCKTTGLSRSVRLSTVW